MHRAPPRLAHLRSSADHYTGLRDTWDAGPIYCSPVTARLLAHICGVKPEFIAPLALDIEHDIQGAEGSEGPGRG